MSDSTISMSSSIIEWLLPGYSLNFAPGIRDAMSRAASTRATGSPVRFITKVGAFDANIIHYRANVVGALLEGRHFHRPVGEAGTAFVEPNQATKFAEPLEEKSALRDLPIQVQMRHRPRRPDHVERPVTGDL